MLKLFGARKLTWNGLVCDEKGSVSPRQECVYDRHCIGKGARGVIHRGKYYIHYLMKDVTLDVAVKETSRTSNNYELENLVELKEEEEIIHLFNYTETLGKQLYIVELCKGGDLLDYVMARPLSVENALHVIHWLLQAVNKCHQHGIIHTDIKLENIGLVNENSLAALRLLDFGNSKRVSDAPFKARQLRGSPHYLAPELSTRIIFTEPSELYALDMWCVGIVAYALLERRFYTADILTFTECKDSFAQTLVQHLLCSVRKRWSAREGVNYFAL